MTLIRAHLISLFTGALAAILVVRKRHKSNALQRDTSGPPGSAAIMAVFPGASHPPSGYDGPGDAA